MQRNNFAESTYLSLNTCLFSEAVLSFEVHLEKK